MRSITRTAAAIAIAAAGAAAGGCAYSLSPSGNLAHRTIAVPMFTNESLQYGLEEQATNAIQQAFISDNRMKVVSPADAETVLHGTIKKYNRGAYTYDESEHVQEYKVEITIDLDYVDVATGKSIWHEPAYYVWASYRPEGPAPTDSLGPAVDEQGAIQQALAKAGRETVARTIEGW